MIFQSRTHLNFGVFSLCSHKFSSVREGQERAREKEGRARRVAMAERKLRLGEVSHLVMTFLHDEQEAFPATRAAFEHEARDALKAIKPGRRGVKTLYEILDEYLELKQEQKEREDRKACFKYRPSRPLPGFVVAPRCPSLTLCCVCAGKIRRPRSR